MRTLGAEGYQTARQAEVLPAWLHHARARLVELEGLVRTEGMQNSPVLRHTYHVVRRREGIGAVVEMEECGDRGDGDGRVPEGWRADAARLAGCPGRGVKEAGSRGGVLVCAGVGRAAFLR